MKLFGKNISVRSYSTLSKFQSTVYLYGGYSITNGISSDFYQFDIEASKFEWKIVV